MKDHEIHTHDLLNAQTGRIAWSELARYFARGLVVSLARGDFAYSTGSVFEVSGGMNIKHL